MTGLLTAQDVVDIENIITILVIITIVLHTFARLGQHATWISRGLVVKVRVADAIRRWKVGRQRLEGLRETTC